MYNFTELNHDEMVMIDGGGWIRDLGEFIIICVVVILEWFW